MKPIDGRLIAEQARAYYDLDLNDARAETLAGMVRGFLDAAHRAAQVLPMDSEPAQFGPVLDALGNGERA